MEVTKEYQLTEIGKTPIDWEVSLLDKCSKRGSGHTPSKKHKDYYNGGIVWVSLADSNELDKGLINKSHIEISILGLKNSSAVLHPKGTVLLSRDAGIGKSAVAGCDLAVSQHFITWTCDEKLLHNWFLYYWLQYQKKEFERIAIGSTIKTIGLPYFQLYKIPLPSYNEQNKIAYALRDVDILIGSLEKLIAKKRSIKQGAMQMLLKPKEGWVLRKVGEVGNCFAGGTPSTFNLEYWGGEIIWLPSGRVQNCFVNRIDNEKTITQLGLNESAAKLIKSNSVLVAITGATCGNIGLLEFEAAANQSVIAVEPYNEIDFKFLFYLLLIKRKEILSFQTGSAQGGINLNALKSLEVLLPPKKTEQIEISNILFEIDSEIILLEHKLEKYKMIKQGMMQNLLTGRVRLTKKEEPHALPA